MKTSESIKEISGAILQAQQIIGGAKKDASNPFFRTTYSSLGSVMEACKKALNDNGITVLQPVGTTDDGQVYVETVLLHESGEYISDRMPISVKQPNDPQAQGSAITYARRYSLQSMVFIPAEDDDAEGAMDRENTTSKPVRDTGWGQCEGCGADITSKVKSYSISVFGRPLCFDCQKKAKNVEGDDVAFE